MARQIKRSSDKFAIIEFFSLIGAIGATTALYFIFPNKIPASQNWVVVFPLGFVGLGLASRVLRWVIGRKECKKGIHDPDSTNFNICRYCHEPQQGHEEKVRQYEERIHQKHGRLKLLLPTIIGVIIVSGMGIFFLSMEKSEIVHEILSMNQTSTACLNLVKDKAKLDANAFMPMDEIKNAVNTKWTQLDCVHQNIMDDLNESCPIGVMPSLHGWTAVDFTCYNNEVRVK